ncbi:MAG TPA: class II aldolase/adducin family protein [Beijerinckiaceae bacterium]|jgi:ribulose-5-phosphate 4-epimerase/fuculose-1-phosphate aldolase|nr:class II aldolase/adducin family protein [Beijerinckiaceae bacterium]
MHRDMGDGVQFKSLRDEVSPQEWEARKELAACYRLVAHFGFNDSISNHMTLRVPGEPDHFLINPGGYLFSEICASSLVKIDLDGNVLSEAPTGIVNPAGYVIHSAVLGARPDANSVIHLHTVPGVTISSRKDGLKFYCQESMRFYGRVGYHDYEGIARDTDEREGLARDLGKDNIVLMLRNHGTLVVGSSVAEAFTWTMSLERSCQIQIAAEGTGKELVHPSEEICRTTLEQTRNSNRPTGDKAWAAFRRLADFHYPSYIN